MNRKLTADDVQLSNAGRDALIVVDLAHEFTAVIREHFRQRQDGRAVLQVIDAKVPGRLQLPAVVEPTHRSSRVRFYLHFESERTLFVKRILF